MSPDCSGYDYFYGLIQCTDLDNLLFGLATSSSILSKIQFISNVTHFQLKALCAVSAFMREGVFGNGNGIDMTIVGCAVTAFMWERGRVWQWQWI